MYSSIFIILDGMASRIRLVFVRCAVLLLVGYCMHLLLPSLPELVAKRPGKVSL
jgi:hypothetical protein